MYNNIVKMYCERYNLQIKRLENTKENLILQNEAYIGYYKDDSKYVEIAGERYKKSDLTLFVLESQMAHEGDV